MKISIFHRTPYQVKGQVMKKSNGIRITFHVPALAEYMRAK